MKRNKQVVPLIAVIILLSCIIIDGCGKKEKMVAPPVPEVAVVTVQPRQVITTTELAGRTSSNLIAEVRPQVGGIIQKRLFTEGSDVRAGQPLFQIDPAIYQAAVSNAGAALARSEAQLTTVQLRAGRLRELLAEKAVSQQEYDDAAAALKQTQADIQYGKANLETASNQPEVYNNHRAHFRSHRQIRCNGRRAGYGASTPGFGDDSKTGSDVCGCNSVHHRYFEIAPQTPGGTTVQKRQKPATGTTPFG